MSGHSKWHSIKHKKGAADAKRGAVFTRVIKELTISARLGGGDADANPRLRTAILKAKSVNMPKDNIERAIKKGTGTLEGVNYVELMYEAYAPGGVALMIEVVTDNKNRTAADIRSTLSKGGGSLGESGCVSYMFKKRGIILYSNETCSTEEVFNAALEEGAEDIVELDGSIEVLTSPEDFHSILTAMEERGFAQEMADIELVADNTVDLDAEKTAKVIRLIERLEEYDDVQNVASNLEIPDDFEPTD